EAKLDKFAALVGPATEIGDISLLVELLSLPGGDRFAPLDLSPQEGVHPGGAAAAARRVGPNAAGADDLRGSALDRSNFARVPCPRYGGDRGLAGPRGRHLPSRVPAALGRPAVRHRDRAEPARAE